MRERAYIAIDLKSFYASVECLERGLNPLTTHLVVADNSRTEKTICLAVTPSLKSYGVPGRPRLFEVTSRLQQINQERLKKIPQRRFTGYSSDATLLEQNPHWEVKVIIAPPRMGHYIQWSTRVYNVYLKTIAPEDIHVYSIDEVFMDVTHYLNLYQMTPTELAEKIVLDVFKETGITATAGVGSNLYLCKVAMDIMAKKIPPNKNGVRVASLDEKEYRRQLWNHQPITDFWRVGKGIARRLEAHGIKTMEDVARCSVGGPKDYWNEELIHRLLGVNGKLLIDHAWGWEPCEMKHIKGYRPTSNSLGSGQVLQSPYTAEKARLVLREMGEALTLDLVDKQLVTRQLTLTIGYDMENLQGELNRQNYHGEVTKDPYGRLIPKHSHGTANLEGYTSSSKAIEEALLNLFDRIVKPQLTIRRLNFSANFVIREQDIPPEKPQQQEFFTDILALKKEKESAALVAQKEKNLQQAALSIKKRYGKNALLRASSFLSGATARERNNQIGGHKA